MCLCMYVVMVTGQMLKNDEALKVCMCVCMYVYVYVCICLYVCVYMHICIYVYMYICMCLCMYVVMVTGQMLKNDEALKVCMRVYV